MSRIMRLLGLVVVTSLLLLTSAAGAATWRVIGGGSFTTRSTTVYTTFTDSRTGAFITCSAGPTFRFTMPNGAGYPGPNLGSVTWVQTGVACSLSGIALTADSLTAPWPINAVSYATGSGGVTTGTITSARYHLYGPGCAFSLNGTNDFRYTNSTGQLSLGPGSLNVVAVSGCLGLIVAGDTMKFNADYSLAPTGLEIFNP